MGGFVASGGVAAVSLGESLSLGAGLGSLLGGVIPAGNFIFGPRVEGSKVSMMTQNNWLRNFVSEVFRISTGFNILSVDEYEVLASKIRTAELNINSSEDKISQLENSVLSALDILYFVRAPIIRYLEIPQENTQWNNNSVMDPMGPLKAGLSFESQTRLVAKRLNLTLLTQALWEMRRDLLELKLARAEK